MILFAIALIIAIAGWFLPLNDFLTPDKGVGYALGIAGAILMLFLFVYSLRKRFPRQFNWLGPSHEILHFHITMGSYGPLFILYHCRFQLGAVNSNIALWSMIVVVLSGVAGRFLYNRKGWEIPFKWWHYAHLPVVGLMLLAVSIHIIASFLY